MKIQVITNDRDSVNIDGVDVNSINSPMSFDNYDINIVDISSEYLWCYEGDKLNSINSIDDFRSIKDIIVNTQRANVIIVLPHNSIVNWDHSLNSGKYYHQDELKNRLSFLKNEIFPNIIPLDGFFLYDIKYERNITRFCDCLCNSDFYFSKDIRFDDDHIVSKAETSGKVTTIKLSDSVYITTIDLINTKGALNSFVNSVFVAACDNDVPEWITDYRFFDDDEIICEKNQLTDSLNDIHKRIEKLDDRLAINNAYKRILFENSNSLVSSVFDILERMLNISLKDFEDVYADDFNFEKEGLHIIGEIKGVSTNVKYEHISQLIKHYSLFADNHPEIDNGKIRMLLIINPFRNIPLDSREKVMAEQIRFAERNNCLIIETKTLLVLFEKFLRNELDEDKCFSILTSTFGLLKLE